MNIAVTAPATLKIGAMPEGALLVVGDSNARWWQFWRRPAVVLLTEADLIWAYQVISKIMKQRATKETPLTQAEEFKDDIERAMIQIGQESSTRLMNLLDGWLKRYHCNECGNALEVTGFVAAKRLAELLSGKGYVKL